MADTVSKQNNEAFLSQAQLHRNFADHTRQMISQYEVLHSNLLDTTQSSCMSDAMQSYMAWWESFRTGLLNHADLHEQMASHLHKTVNGFDDTDQTIQQAFTGNDSGFSS